MKKSAGIVVISNPAAGQRSGGFVKAVLRELVARGHTVELRVTDYPAHAIEIARDCATDGSAYLVVAAGGDGTIREVAEGLMETSMPMGIIPAGTANVLARELGYLKAGSRSVRRTVSILEGSHEEDIYPFSVKLPERETIGLCWVGVGFDGETLRHVNPVLKKKVGRLSFVPAILKAMYREPREPNISWAFDSGEAGACGWALIANIEKYAGPFTVTRKTRLQERGLACLLFPKAGWLARAIDQLEIAWRPLDRSAGTRLLEEGVLTVGGSDTPVQLDGDLVGVGPVTVAPVEAALKFKAANSS